jgi:hypothetical protein
MAGIRVLSVFSIGSVRRLYINGLYLAPYQQTRNRLTVMKMWSKAPDGCFIPRQTGQLIVGRNMTLTWY